MLWMVIFSLCSGRWFSVCGLDGSFRSLFWMAIFAVPWMVVFCLWSGWQFSLSVLDGNFLCALDGGFPAVPWMVIFLWSGWRFTVCGLDFLSEVWMAVFSNCSGWWFFLSALIGSSLCVLDDDFLSQF